MAHLKKERGQNRTKVTERVREKERKQKRESKQERDILECEGHCRARG